MSSNRSQGTPASFLLTGIVIMVLGAILRAAGDAPAEGQLIAGEVVFAVGFLVAVIGAVAKAIIVARDNQT